MRDSGHFVAVIFIDFSKAFDVLNHDILLLKLQLQFNFSLEAVKWLSSYLKDRSQLVNIRDSYSDTRDIKSGVAQGSILGPLLFLLYINDIQNCLTKAEARLFADDTALVVTAKSRTELLRICGLSMNQISHYCRLNSLFIHPVKTKIMYFQEMPAYMDHSLVSLNGNTIEAVKTYKYLGYILDNKLSLHDHCLKIAAKISSSQAALKRCSRFLNSHCITLVANALIGSHLNFSHTLLVVSDCAAFKKLRSTYNRVTTILLKHEIVWPALENRLINLNIRFLANIATKRCPSYLEKYIIMETRERRSNRYKCKLTNRAQSTRGISYWGPRLAVLLGINLTSTDRLKINEQVEQYLDSHQEHSQHIIPYSNSNNVLRSF